MRYSLPEVDVYFGNSLKEITLRIQCRCGQAHEFPLDASGHYTGSIPCDKVTIDVQIKPQIWRDLVTSYLENTTQ